MKVKKDYSFKDIKGLLPYDYPFLFIDKGTLIERGRKIRCIKNVTGNENYFRAHFKDEPIMPGVIIVEAMAQATFLLEVISAKNIKANSRRGYLARIKDMRFLKGIYPGDQINIEVEIKTRVGNTELIEAKAFVDGNMVCKGELIFAMLPVDKTK